MNFEDLGLAEPLLRGVRAQGYRTATPIQVKAIPDVLQGRDLMGCAQTGTGKTAAFALPTLQQLSDSPGKQGAAHSGNRRGGRRPIRALILAPTRELAVQIGESFIPLGVRSFCNTRRGMKLCPSWTVATRGITHHTELP